MPKNLITFNWSMLVEAVPGVRMYIYIPQPRQQNLLAARWPNVDPVGSTLGQRGPNVPCYLGIFSRLFNPGTILCLCPANECMRPANERRRYIVTSSLIGWAHAQMTHVHLCRFCLLVTMPRWVVADWLPTDRQYMMTLSNGNIFHVTGPLCGEFTGPGEFPAQWPVRRSFDVFFDLRPKRLSKQPWGWWFETPSWPLWRQCNDILLLFETRFKCRWNTTEYIWNILDNSSVWFVITMSSLWCRIDAYKSSVCFVIASWSLWCRIEAYARSSWKLLFAKMHMYTKNMKH